MDAHGGMEWREKTAALPKISGSAAVQKPPSGIARWSRGPRFPLAGINFSTDQGTLHMSSHTDHTGSFIIAAAPVPEIDPAGMGSVLALVTGALGLLERRRLKAKAA